MKKNLLIISLLLFVFTGKSQIPGLTLKLMGGVNSPSFSMQSATASKNDISYAFSLDAALGKKSYIQPGIAIRKYSGDFTVNSVSSNLVIPVYNIHAYYGRQLLNLMAVKLRLFGGLGYDKLGTPVSDKFTIDPKDYNPYAINFVIGTELKVFFALVSFQYEIGMTDLTANYAMKNNVFIAKIGFSFL